MTPNGEATTTGAVHSCTRAEAIEFAFARSLETGLTLVVYETNMQGHYSWCSEAAWYNSQNKLARSLVKEVS